MDRRQVKFNSKQAQSRHDGAQLHVRASEIMAACIEVKCAAAAAAAAASASATA